MVADLFSLLAQTASPKREAEKGRIAQTASPKGEAEKGRKTAVALERQSGEKVGAAVGADLFSLLAQTASPKGEAEKAGTIPRRAGIKIDEVYTHIRLRIRGNRFRKAIL